MSARFIASARAALCCRRVRLRALRDRYVGVRVRLYRVRNVSGMRRLRRVGTSRKLEIGLRTRRVKVRVRRPLRPGRYVARAVGTDAYGRRIRVSARSRRLLAR